MKAATHLLPFIVNNCRTVERITLTAEIMINNISIFTLFLLSIFCNCRYSPLYFLQLPNAAFLVPGTLHVSLARSKILFILYGKSEKIF